MTPFPDMSEAFADLTSTIQFALIGKSVRDHQVVETVQDIKRFQGVIQPLPPQRLMIKPEGERDWKYWTLWTTHPLQLDDVVADPSGKQYRVTQEADWSGAGFHEMELTEQPRTVS